MRYYNLWRLIRSELRHQAANNWLGIEFVDLSELFDNRTSSKALVNRDEILAGNDTFLMRLADKFSYEAG